jgi:hypothetical protein
MDGDREPDQHRTRGRGQRSGDVAVSGPVGREVHDVEQAIDEAQGTEGERQPGAQPRPQEGKGDDGHDARAHRYRRCESVLAQANAGLAVDEGVVERVHEQHTYRRDEDERLA